MQYEIKVSYALSESDDAGWVAHSVDTDGDIIAVSYGPTEDAATAQCYADTELVLASGEIY